MASPEVLDFPRLLAPIPGENPAGADLRLDSSSVSDYHAIRSARKAASDADRLIDQWTRSPEQPNPPEAPDWRTVLQRGAKSLAEKSKDMEVTAYVVEAVVRLHGFAGLRDGFRLARELIVTFWDHLYPLAEDPPDVETRFSHIFWLNGIDKAGTLIVPVRKTPLTGLASDGGLNLSQYLQAESLGKISDPKAKQRKIDEGAITLDIYKRAIAETPSKFFVDLVQDIAQCQEEFRKFCQVLGEKSGYDPPSSDLLGVLDACLDVIKDLARDKLPKAPPQATAVVATAEAGASMSTTTQPAPSADPAQIRDRGDALDRLGKVAAYFREHEPHSIIPFALEQVVTWGKMPLPELLAELIPDDAPRKSLFKQVGIKPPEVKK